MGFNSLKIHEARDMTEDFKLDEEVTTLIYKNLVEFTDIHSYYIVRQCDITQNILDKSQIHNIKNFESIQTLKINFDLEMAPDEIKSLSMMVGVFKEANSRSHLVDIFLNIIGNNVSETNFSKKDNKPILDLLLELSQLRVRQLKMKLVHEVMNTIGKDIRQKIYDAYVYNGKIDKIDIESFSRNGNPHYNWTFSVTNLQLRGLSSIKACLKSGFLDFKKYAMTPHVCDSIEFDSDELF